MAMVINHNLPALNTYNRLSINNNAVSGSLEKLSSGLRINRAGDDAAGLAISEKMRGQIRGLDQASRNAQDGISLIQTAEGALNETHSMLQRMRELAVQANNGTNSDQDISAIQQEIQQLSDEITATAQKTQFNGKDLLTGTLGTQISKNTTLSSVYGNGVVDSVTFNGGLTADVDAAGNVGGPLTWTLADNGDGTYDLSATTTAGDNYTYTSSLEPADNTAGVLNFGGKISIALNDSYTTGALDTDTISISGNQTILQIGANSNQELSLSFNDMQATALGTGAGAHISDVDVTNTTQSFATRLQIIDDAIKQVSDERAKMGAAQNRLDHTINNLSTSSENLTAAESRIRDVDMAKEMMSFTKNNILVQASTAMLAQANQEPQGVLQLLK